MIIQPIWPIFEVNRLNWKCCLAGSYKTAMDADYEFALISIETYALQFIGHNKLFLGSAWRQSFTEIRGALLLQCAPDFDVKVSVLSMVICRSSPSKRRWCYSGGDGGGGTCRCTCRRKGSLKLRQLPRRRHSAASGANLRTHHHHRSLAHSHDTTGCWKSILLYRISKD